MWHPPGKLLGLPVATLLGGIKQRELGAFQAVSLPTQQEARPSWTWGFDAFSSNWVTTR